MTLNELGQKVKTKYPEYKSLSDEEAGKKVIEKYPQYRSSVSDLPAEKEGFNLFKGIYNLAIKPTAEGVANYGKLIGSGLSTAGAVGLTSGAGLLEKLSDTELAKKAKIDDNLDRAASGVADAGVNTAEYAAKLRENSGLSGSFAADSEGNRDIGSGIGTLVKGGLDTLGGVGAAYNIASLGTAGSLKGAFGVGSKELTRNLITNSAIYGTGETAKAIREGENVPNALLMGSTGQSTTGIFEGISGDTKNARSADTVLSILAPIIFGKKIEQATDDAVGAIGAVASKTGKSASEIAKPLTSKIGPRISKVAQKNADELFASTLLVPARISRRLKTLDTVRTLNEYGISGNLDDLQEISSRVTGESGVLSKATRDVIGRIDKPISVDSAIDAAQFELGQSALLDDRMEKKILNVITRTIKPGEGIGESSSLDAFDAVKKLEEIGYSYLNKSTDLSPNPQVEEIGKVYLSAAEALKENIDEAQAAKNIIDAVKTEDNIEALRQVSPLLAERFKSAKTLADLRKLQSPFVRIAQLARISQENSTSPLVQALTKPRAGINEAFGLLNPVTAIINSGKVRTKTSNVISNLGLVDPTKK